MEIAISRPSLRGLRSRKYLRIIDCDSSPSNGLLTPYSLQELYAVPVQFRIPRPINADLKGELLSRAAHVVRSGVPDNVSVTAVQSHFYDELNAPSVLPKYVKFSSVSALWPEGFPRTDSPFYTELEGRVHKGYRGFGWAYRE